jgi:hypothetical protein
VVSPVIDETAKAVGNVAKGSAADKLLPQRYRLEPPRGASPTVTGIRDTLGGRLKGNPPRPVGEPVIRLDAPHGGTPYPHVNVDSLGHLDPHIPISSGALKAAGKAARVIEGAGKIALPVAIAVDTVRLGVAVYEDKGIGRNTEVTAGSVAGGWAGAAGGAWAGAEGGALLGAAIGSVVPVLGTAAGAAIGGLAGGLIGAIAGGFFGSWAGEKGVEKVVD